MKPVKGILNLLALGIKKLGPRVLLSTKHLPLKVFVICDMQCISVLASVHAVGIGMQSICVCVCAYV